MLGRGELQGLGRGEVRGVSGLDVVVDTLDLDRGDGALLSQGQHLAGRHRGGEAVDEVAELTLDAQVVAVGPRGDQRVLVGDVALLLAG
ncbi:hypothetical protein HMPREF0058_1635 [Actinomyces urogenitalis DSM 15434]|uniref:Uncharacterized protein n=2 Tax=Actinomyces urogenitalis TaxID=103621 RepID=C0W6Z1_9ACTO|nr:hypothetical protein HMPREF0058_1635 [Actinomyces urogenitalis DSM 15434]KGF05003.1 hypothetical protein HMPREF1626_00615 [Actinomyces urogenitalis S6-C4]PKY98857.1 hypothetical protein CYJ26_05585 [Actinomyces urogenitalis]